MIGLILALLLSLTEDVNAAACDPQERGRGSYTTNLRLYKPLCGEKAGAITDTSSNSIVVNFDIIESTISNASLNPSNTNYIRLTSSLQSGATFYTSSGTVGTQFTVGNGTFTAFSSGRVGLSSSTPLNTLGVQGGGHFSSSVTASNFFTSDGTQILSTAAPVSGSTNYIRNTSDLQSGSTFYVASGTVQGNLTVTGHFATSGPVTLGDSAGDLLTVQSSSVTLPNATTIYFNSPISRIFNSSGTVGHNIVFNPDGNLELLISSTPTTLNGGFATINSTALDLSKAKMAILKISALTECDGDANQGGLDFHLRRTGSGVTAGSATRWARSLCGSTNPSDAPTDFNLAVVALDANRDFDFHCKALADVEGQVCEIYLAGWIE